MLSKLKIDLDADNQPIIQVDYRPSDDVRDKMVKRFIETFGGESVFARVVFEPNMDFTDKAQLSFKVRPIPSNEFTQTIQILEEFQRVNPK